MNLFAYGTLMDPDIIARVSGARFRGEPATLHGYARKRLAGEVYPAIFRHAGSLVGGVVYFDVSLEAFARLDRFEGSTYLRVEASAQRANEGHVLAQAYVIAPEYVSQLTDEDWSYSAFAERAREQFLGWKPSDGAG